MKIVHYSRADLQKKITAAHTFVRDADMKQTLASDIFEFLNEAYKYIGGFQSFTGEDDFVDRSYVWYVTTHGAFDSLNPDMSNIYTVSVFKQKYGLKLVGVGNNRFSFIDDAHLRKRKKAEARAALESQIKWAATKGWMEVSGSLGKLVEEVLPTSYIIEPEDLLTIFPDIQIMPDGLSYARTLSNGLDVVKRAYGNIKIQ